MLKRKQIVITVLFLVAMFIVGGMIRDLKEDYLPAGGKVLAAENWGLGFGADGTRPAGNVSAEELAKYDAYYVAPATEEMKLYLTFDCGYENGNTEAILDALKKHGVSATFFVVGHFLESAPDMVVSPAALPQVPAALPRQYFLRSFSPLFLNLPTKGRPESDTNLHLSLKSCII